MEQKAVVEKIYPTKSGTGARGVWSSTDVKIVWKNEKDFDQSMVVTFFNKQEDVAKLSVGASGTFKINPKATEWNDRPQNNFNVWSVWLDNAPQSSAPQAQPTQSAPTQSSGGYEPAF